MTHWLARPGDAKQWSHIKRFDPRYWTIDFPRPMMAALTTSGAHALRVDCVFYKTDDLAGLIWEAEDRRDHPLLAYETGRDFRHCRLSFRWRSGGIMPLDAVNGPTLTIEGRDAQGAPHTWYVRLWNYAQGTPADALIDLDFDALDGGFILPGEADPVWAGDIDRLFISLVPPGYTGADALLPAPAEAWVELSEIGCDGSGSVLRIGDAFLPPHRLSIATGYDDLYHLTPERLLRNMLHLGYRGSINHYVGMSHYFRLEAAAGGLYASLQGGALNAPCAAWHSDFAARAAALGYSLIVSLSFELFDAHCWNDWKQRAWNGDPALTGWQPPSALLSPAHAGAMAYLQAVARAFMALVTAAGQAPRFQIGEPWWWVGQDGRIFLYDDAASAALGGNPPEIADVRNNNLSAAQLKLLDDAGSLLAAATAALKAAVKADHPQCETLILVYLPTVLAGASPHVARANVPTGWAWPAFDVLQLEDYDWVTTGNRGASARAIAAMEARLGYGAPLRHYLSGFVLLPEHAAQWRAIDAAALAALRDGTAEVFVWALPQVLRDGFVHMEWGEEAVQPFDDVSFPLALAQRASVVPQFSTSIVTSAAGFEQRNADWASARLSFDAGPGVRSDADLETLIAFFRARRGPAKAFRFRDPYDHSSNGMTGAPSATDQHIGLGDGVRTAFDLVKRYGAGADAEVRRIARPVAGSVAVAVDGAPAQGWTLAQRGRIVFETPPAAGALVTAGFLFDVPVRFAEDSLRIEGETWAAGEAPGIPLVEVREESADG